MNSTHGVHSILKELKRFKKKFFLNKLVSGILLTFASLVLLWLSLSLLEHFLWLNSKTRFILLLLFGFICSYIFWVYLIIPFKNYLLFDKKLTDEKASSFIGQNEASVSDILLNIIQLNKNTKQEDSSLYLASIAHKIEQIGSMKFDSLINIRQSNHKYFYYFSAVILILLSIYLFNPSSITESGYRILKYQESFAPPAPFSFELLNEKLEAYAGENINLSLRIEGEKLPSTVFIHKNGIDYKMNHEGDNIYSFSLNTIRNNTDIYFEAAGFRSKLYNITVSEKPVIQEVVMEVNYPAYLKEKPKRYQNMMNLTVPEGSEIRWFIQANHTEQLLLKVNDSLIEQKNKENSIHRFSLNPSKDLLYSFSLKNADSKTEQTEDHSINLLKDQYPSINLSHRVDSTLFQSILINGGIIDDHGFRSLALIYEIKRKGQIIDKRSIIIPINKEVQEQDYYYIWNISSLNLAEEDQLEFYTVVQDNDALHSYKKTKSQTVQYKLPNESEVDSLITKQRQLIDNQLINSNNDAQSLEEKLQEINDLLKTKQQLNFEDKEAIKELLEESQNIEEQLKKIQEELMDNLAKEETLKGEQNEELKKKTEQLIDLTKDIQDPSKEALLEKIKELMQKTQNSKELQESMSQLQQKENNRLRELERLMKLYQRLQIEYQLTQTSQRLERLAEKQENTEKVSNAEEQKALNDLFKEIQEQLEKTKEENQQLDNPAPIKDSKELENDIQQQQNESLEQLKKENQQGAKNSQQQAAEKMKEMAKMMNEMASGMQGEQLQENIQRLREIVDDLLKLSYRQEEIMRAMKEINPSNPIFLELSEKQLYMKEDAKVIEDSLYAIANRVFQIKNAITSEMNLLNESIDASLDHLKVREDNKAVASQQASMESINNLSLLIDDIIQQMQMQMNSSGKGSSSNEQTPSASELQKALNQKTQELNQQQKEGREYSETIAELAAEQARIRKMLKESLGGKDGEEGEEEGNGTKGEKEGEGEEAGKSGSSGSLAEMIEEMDKIEEELVNKRINQRLFERQQQLVTKLLESERSDMEQEEKDEREGETATDYENNKIPKAFEKYLQERKKEIEQLKYVSPSLSPYYQNELNKYYNRLKTEPKPNIQL